MSAFLFIRSEQMVTELGDVFSGMVKVNDVESFRKVQVDQVFNPFAAITEGDDLMAPTKLVESGSRTG